MARKERFQMHKNVAKSIIVTFVVHAVYIAGLSMLIPLMFLLIFPEEVLLLTEQTSRLLIVSLVLITLSVVILFMHKRSLKRTFRDLGLMTLIPGGASLVFSYLGKEYIVDLVKKYIIDLREIELVVGYVEHTLPKIQILVIGYIIIGAFLLYLSYKMN